MKKYYNSRDELSKDLRIARKEAFREVVQFKTMYHKLNRKKIIKWSILMILSILLFKLLIGTFVIALSYPNNRMYAVTINKTMASVGVIEEKILPIIPFLFDLKLYSNNTFYGEDLSTVYKLKQGQPVVINIESYKCFVIVGNTKTQIKCGNNDSNIIYEKTDDTKYKLFIRETIKNGIVLYDGALINDITSYLTKKGYYYVEIRGVYSNVNSRIYFWIRII